MSHPVKINDVRPARPDGTCFYCRVPVGGEHADGCVLRTKRVVVEVAFTFVKEFPEDWDTRSMEFMMNDSSSCANNLLDDFAVFCEALEKRGGCACARTKARYVRDATPEDEIGGGAFYSDGETPS